MRLQEFALGLGSGFEDLLNPNSSLHSRFVTHERVVLNPNKETITYRPDFELHSKDDLLQLVRDRFDAQFPSKELVPLATRRYPLKSVLKMSDLRESWPDAKNAVEQLAKTEPKHDREILLWKGSKDGNVKAVAWNPICGAEAEPVDQGERSSLSHVVVSSERQLTK